MVDNSEKKNKKRDGKPGYLLIEIGEYYGAISTEYTDNGKYEELIMLSLYNEKKLPILFYADMAFNETYTEVESKFGYREGEQREVKLNIENIAFYEIFDKYESNQPITLPVFIDLVLATLKEKFFIDGKLRYINIPYTEVERYFTGRRQIKYGNCDQKFLDYFYVSKSVFDCRLNKSEELIIDDYNSTEFPEVILGFTWLKKLELYELLISEIPEELTNLKNLKSLSIKLKFLTKLPSSLFRLKNLEVLKLEQTGISELNKSLSDLQNLKELHITDNQELTIIPDEISRLRLLEFLYIYDNQISSLPETIWRLENLKVLHLRNNLIESVPDELTALPKLMVLNLSKNRLREIPENLFEMDCIQEVDLSNNPLLDKDKVYQLLMKSEKRDQIKIYL